jgi:hypothetical protein
MSANDPPTGTLAGTIVLLVLGLLVLVPSGLCTGYFGIAGAAAMFEPRDAGYGVLFLAGALILGGPFVAAGIAMLWIGVRRMRAR